MNANNEAESRKDALSILWAAYYKTEHPTAKRIVYHALIHVRMASERCCAGCGQEIDPDVCWCGQSIDHGYDNHPVIPMGCDCYRDRSETAVGGKVDVSTELRCWRCGCIYRVDDEPFYLGSEVGSPVITLKSPCPSCDAITSTVVGVSMRSDGTVEEEWPELLDG